MINESRLQGVPKSTAKLTRRKSTPTIHGNSIEINHHPDKDTSYLIFDNDADEDSNSVYVDTCESVRSYKPAVAVYSSFAYPATGYHRDPSPRCPPAVQKRGSSDIAERIQARQLEKFAAFQQSFGLSGLVAEANSKQPFDITAVFDRDCVDPQDADIGEDEQLRLETHRILRLSNESSRADFGTAGPAPTRRSSTSSRTSSRTASWDSHPAATRNAIFKPNMMLSATTPFIKGWSLPSRPANKS